MAARSGIVGLGSRLYPGNMQRIFNKDLTRFMQSLFSRTPKSSKQKKGSASRVSLRARNKKIGLDMYATLASVWQIIVALHLKAGI